MTKQFIIVALLLWTLSVGGAAQTPDSSIPEPTVTWQELEAHVAAPATAPIIADQVQLLVETWDNLLALNNPDGIISVSTPRFQEETFGSTENLRAAFASPAPTFIADRSGDITVRDARLVDAETVSAFVHISGYEDPDPESGRVYFGIFRRVDDIWKIDYLRPELLIVDQTDRDVVVAVVTAADFERNGLPRVEIATP